MWPFKKKINKSEALKADAPVDDTKPDPEAGLDPEDYTIGTG